MSNLLKYRASIDFNDHDSKIALYYRSIKKICRKCNARLPIDANICKKCHNTDLRIKHKLRAYNGHHDKAEGGHGHNNKKSV